MYKSTYSTAVLQTWITLIWIRMRLFTLMRIRIRILHFTYMRIRIFILMLYPDPETARHQSDANLHPLGLGTPTSQTVSLHGCSVSLHGSRVRLHGSRVSLMFLVSLHGSRVNLFGSRVSLHGSRMSNEHPCMAPLWASTTPGFSLLMRIRIRRFTLMRTVSGVPKCCGSIRIWICITAVQCVWKPAETLRLASG
jgi:hypothetical protein